MDGKRRAIPEILVACALTTAGGWIASCGSSKSADDDGAAAASVMTGDFSKASVTGKFSGKTWTYQSGRALPSGSGSGDDELYTVELVDDAVGDPCSKFSFAADDKKKLSLVTSLAVGDQTLDKDHPVTFDDEASSPGKNTVVTSGKSTIVEKTKAQVRGRLKTADDKNNSVNGTFTISICCETEERVSYQACQ